MTEVMKVCDILTRVCIALVYILSGSMLKTVLKLMETGESNHLFIKYLAHEILVQVPKHMEMDKCYLRSISLSIWTFQIILSHISTMLS